MRNGAKKTGVLPVEDRYPDTGPMGGIASVLESCSEEAVSYDSL